MKRRNHYAAIPTVYRNVRFRSRLEAKWAALFDICGLQWEYEPFDMGANSGGYIPDFLIQLARPTLVEVKPITSPSEFRAPQKKLARCGWTGPALVLGSSLYLHPDDDLPEITARGTLACGVDGWSRMGRTAWPRAMGPCPFTEDLWTAWTEAANASQWKPPKAD